MCNVGIIGIVGLEYVFDLVDYDCVMVVNLCSMVVFVGFVLLWIVVCGGGVVVLMVSIFVLWGNGVINVYVFVKVGIV